MELACQLPRSLKVGATHTLSVADNSFSCKTSHEHRGSILQPALFRPSVPGHGTVWLGGLMGGG